MEKLKHIATLLILLSLPQILFSQDKSLPLKKKNVPQWTADIVIVGGTVVTMDEKRRIIEDGAVVIKDGKIVLVGARQPTTYNLTAKQTINATGKVIIPGLINTHTHIPMTLFRGIADDLDLQEWLNKYIFPAEGKNVDENLVRVGTRLGLAELIRGGTTTYCDMYYFEDAIADESSKAGVRGVLGQTIIDFPAPDFKNNQDAMDGTEKFVKKWQNHPLVIPAVAPHAPYTVSEEHLRSASNLSRKYNAPLVMHLAEAQSETDFVMQNKGMRSIEYIDKIGFFTGRTIAAHVIQANEKELDILKKYNVGIAHNPQSNMKLAAGVAPVPQMLRKNLRVGLGTDGAASNNDLNLWEEMDTAAKLHKLISGDPKVMSAPEVFEMATIGGARALHLEDKIGSIEAGKLADIAIVDFDGLHQTPFYNMYSHLVYATKSSDVSTVLINGNIVMLNKTLLTLNESSIKIDANAHRNKIIKSLEDKE
jgi:5-methylthioadenosine/S-adenosylhomocysteine deaminase